MSFYRRNLPHFQRDYRPHFITFVTKHRLILPDWARAIVLNSCLYGHGKKYSLYVVVVMPDHVHMILTPRVDLEHNEIYALPKILRSIKGFSARKINSRLRVRATWQEESFDRVLPSSESLDAKIAYVLANPVRKGLVRMPQEYPWLWRKPVESPYAPNCDARL